MPAEGHMSDTLTDVVTLEAVSEREIHKPACQTIVTLAYRQLSVASRHAAYQEIDLEK